FGVGYALHFPATNMAVLQVAPAHQAALVTGMLFSMAFAGASAGITLSSALLNVLSKDKLMQLITAAHVTYNPIQQLMVENVASGAQAMSKITSTFPPVDTAQAMLIAQQGFSFGLFWVLVICIGLALLAMVIALLTLKNIHFHENKDEFILDV